MSRYEVYATRWDDPHIIEELIPARGLEFSLPLNDHGSCSFSATVEPARSFWRPAIAPVMSGVLVARDGVPVWCGWVVSENQTGARTFSFEAVEWGAFFERTPAKVGSWAKADDFVIFRDLIDDAQGVAGQDVQVTYDAGLVSAHQSDLTINSWDRRSTFSAFHEVAERGGPDWYFGAGGTLADPSRLLVMGDALGHVEAQAVLEFVEDSQEYQAPDDPPSIALLGDLYGVGESAVVPGRRGGNVLAVARSRGSSASATQVVGTGNGVEDAQLVHSEDAGDLIDAGWPRITRWANNSDISHQSSLARWTSGQLAASRGLTTGFSLVTLDGDPDWTQTPRGSLVRVRLDTDVYGAERPVGGDEGFTTRLLSTTVRVPDDGPAQVEWDVATVQEEL